MTLLDEIDNFLTASGMAPSTLGRRAVGSGHIVGRLRAGENVTMRTVERLRDFMRDYRAATATSSKPEDQARVA